MALEVRPLASLLNRPRLRLLPPLDALFPEGLLTGSVLTLSGCGAATLACCLASAVQKEGGFVAVAGLPHLSLAAAAEEGLNLKRTVCFPDLSPSLLPQATSSLLEGFDAVMAEGDLREREGKLLAKKAKLSNSFLFLLTEEDRPSYCDHHLFVSSSWNSLGEGWGMLSKRLMKVRLTTKGEITREVQIKQAFEVLGGKR